MCIHPPDMFARAERTAIELPRSHGAVRYFPTIRQTHPDNTGGATPKPILSPCRPKAPPGTPSASTTTYGPPHATKPNAAEKTYPKPSAASSATTPSDSTGAEKPNALHSTRDLVEGERFPLKGVSCRSCPHPPGSRSSAHTAPTPSTSPCTRRYRARSNRQADQPSGCRHPSPCGPGTTP